MVTKVFEHSNFGKLRVTVNDGEPWFVVCDVVKALRISNPYLTLNRVPEKDKTWVYLAVHAGTPKLRAVNEEGLRRLVYSCYHDEREEYGIWLRNEVLPAVRNTTPAHNCSMTVVKRDAPTVKGLVDLVSNVGSVLENEGVTDGMATFDHPSFGTVRVIVEGSKPLFCGSDVAKALGYARPNDALTAHCRCTVKRSIPHPQSPNSKIEMSFIARGDVFRLITTSKLPSAEAFEHWLFDEMLPTLFTTGSYSLNGITEKDIPQILRLLADNLEKKNAELTEKNNQILSLKAAMDAKRFINDHHADLTAFIRKCVNSYGATIYGKGGIAFGYGDYYRALKDKIGEDVRDRGTPAIHYIEDHEMPVALRIARDLVGDRVTKLFDIKTLDLVEEVIGEAA